MASMTLGRHLWWICASKKKAAARESGRFSSQLIVCFHFFSFSISSRADGDIRCHNDSRGKFPQDNATSPLAWRILDMGPAPQHSRLQWGGRRKKSTLFRASLLVHGKLGWQHFSNRYSELLLQASTDDVTNNERELPAGGVFTRNAPELGDKTESSTLDSHPGAGGNGLACLGGRPRTRVRRWREKAQEERQAVKALRYWYRRDSAPLC